MNIRWLKNYSPCGRKDENMTEKRKREKKQRTRQIIFRTAAAAFVVIVVTVVILHGIDTAKSGTKTLKGEKLYHFHEVEPGENLYGIAGKYMDVLQYDSRSDYIKEIQLMNHLEDEKIVAGDRLVVPIYVYDIYDLK